MYRTYVVFSFFFFFKKKNGDFLSVSIIHPYTYQRGVTSPVQGLCSALLSDCVMSRQDSSSFFRPWRIDKMAAWGLTYCKVPQEGRVSNKRKKKKQPYDTQYHADKHWDKSRYGSSRRRCGTIQHKGKRTFPLCPTRKSTNFWLLFPLILELCSHLAWIVKEVGYFKLHPVTFYIPANRTRDSKTWQLARPAKRQWATSACNGSEYL
jgi:hypothetical protein